MAKSLSNRRRVSKEANHVVIDRIPEHLQAVLNRLQGVRPTRNGWDALCPCPDHNTDGDQNPSLGVTLGDDGRILLHCRVGCPPDLVLDELGLDWPDLFPSDSSQELYCSNVIPSTNGVVSRPEKADADLCDKAYGLLLRELPLADEHRQDLRRRGLSDGEIDRREYRSLRNTSRGRAASAVHRQLGDAILRVPGFVVGPFGVTLHGEMTGLVIPVRELHGLKVALKIRRAADPKYVYVTGGPDGSSPGSPVHVPLGVIAPVPVVRVTEGELKADVCAALDQTTPTIGVPGVSQWRGVFPVLKALGAGTVVIAYDSPNVHDKVPVFEQTEQFWQALRKEGFNVFLEDWHDGP
jgi:hypothetical protein